MYLNGNAAVPVVAMREHINFDVYIVINRLLGIRQAPQLTPDHWKELTPIGLFSALSHALSVFAMGAGTVSFGQVSNYMRITSFLYM